MAQSASEPRGARRSDDVSLEHDRPRLRRVMNEEDGDEVAPVRNVTTSGPKRMRFL
jgi:hypothetical protein